MELNERQKEAVDNLLGPMLIVAGAGSGKTRVLTERIARLLEGGVEPERILALTFTKKAAEEMRSRIALRCGDTVRRVTMGTFHSVFIRFLRPFASRLGFPENFTILDEDDSLRCLKRCIEEVTGEGRPPKDDWSKEQAEYFAKLDAPYKPKAIQTVISACKNELMGADAYMNDPYSKISEERAQRPLTGRIFKHYEQTCLRMGMMDFDDILLYTWRLLEGFPDAAAMLAGAFDFILVDEYQDTNRAQYMILKKLTWINKNICVVGDDSQSIYAFRGARIENILHFKDEYPGCRVIKLERNYRSTPVIVKASNNLISRNEGRIEKTCYAEGGTSEPIGLKVCPEEKAEARYIADRIGTIHAGGVPLGEIAVLYRTNAQSRAIEDALVKANVPYTVYSGKSFFERAEVKDLMAYFRLAVNPHDDESFRRVVNNPARGVGKGALERLTAFASGCNLSLFDALSDGRLPYTGLKPRAMAGLEAFASDILRCSAWAKDLTAHEAAVAISDLAGLKAAYEAEGDEESLRRADNLRELVDSVKAYEDDLGAGETPTLWDYLQNIMLLSNADTDDGRDGDRVSLMTVHCAKGLEYDTVIIAGMEEDLFPLKIDGTPFEEEEERRLFYVAVTRAKRKVILTEVKERLRNGKRNKARPSHFIDELSSPSKK